MVEEQPGATLQLDEETFETVQVDKNGAVIARLAGQCRKYSEDLGNGVLLEMVQIPSGMFAMGTRGSREFEDELPQHQVRIHSFFMSKYPVTQEQWQALMSWEPRYRTRGLRHPVDRVSWRDAMAFCARLSKRSGATWRLPSEAEWEYACRAGTQGPFSFGETITTDLANYVGEHTYQSEPKGVYRHGSSEVGMFPPNAFGLCDMHGNVWEWCADTWHENYINAPTDGAAWESGSKPAMRVMRGGCWHEPPVNCRSAARLGMAENESEDYFGFRLAISHPEDRQPGAGGWERESGPVSRIMTILGRIAPRKANHERKTREDQET